MFDVLRCDTFGGRTLLDRFEHDLLHLFVRGLEFTNEDNSDFLGVVECVLGVHEWNDETDGLQEGGKTFSAVQTNYRARETSAPHRKT